MNTLTLPSCWYHKKNQTEDNWLNTRLVSSLRQHTQWKHSPAFGHQARNNSAASLWPERDDALSREALLAEQVSLNRRLIRRRREDGAARGSVDIKRGCQSELSGEKPKRRRFNPSRHQCRLRTSEKAASSHQFPWRVFGPRQEASSPRGKVKQKNVLKLMRGLRVQDVNDGHRWSLEPLLRLENHAVFVQPVKDYVTRRWRVFRSGSRKRSSASASNRNAGKGPDYQRVASSTSTESIQLSRRTQVMTMTQSGRTSLGQLDPDGEASSSAQAAGRERIMTIARAPQVSIKHAQTTATSEPVIAIEQLDEDIPLESTDYFPSTECRSRQLLPSLESGQTRNRTSTSGTTVYNPPLIAEASLNSKKLESDGSTSSYTSR